MTKVVNLNKEDYDVYIGSKNENNSGYFNNPIAINKECPVCLGVHTFNNTTLSCYEEYLRYRINTDKVFMNSVKNLHNKVLGCTCKPSACHGDILSIYIKRLNRNN
jgi:hypothetical protein